MSGERASEPFVKALHNADGTLRALKAYFLGETEDKLFFRFRRPGGDVVLILKTTVQQIQPISEVRT